MVMSAAQTGWKSTTVTCEMRICGERTGLNAPAQLLTRAYLQRMWEAWHCRGGRTKTSLYVRPLSSESPSAPEPAGLLSSHIYTELTSITPRQHTFVQFVRTKENESKNDHMRVYIPAETRLEKTRKSFDTMPLFMFCTIDLLIFLQ